MKKWIAEKIWQIGMCIIRLRKKELSAIGIKLCMRSINMGYKK